jgi:hypothetical protein
MTNPANKTPKQAKLVVSIWDFRGRLTGVLRQIKRLKSGTITPMAMAGSAKLTRWLSRSKKLMGEV